MTAAATAAPASSARHAWRRFARHRLAVASFFILVLLCLLAFSAPLFELALGTDSERVDLFSRHAPPSAEAFSAPTSSAGTSSSGCSKAARCRCSSA